MNFREGAHLLFMAVEKSGVIAAKLFLRIVVIHHPFDAKLIGESAKIGIPESVLKGHFDFSTCRQSVEKAFRFFFAVSSDRKRNMVAHEREIWLPTLTV